MSSIDCGKFIAELRKDKRITQTELADLLKVSNSAISRWETGEGFPDISIFPRLAEILNVSVDELLKGHRIEKEQKMSLKKTNRRFKNASIGSIVILISAFLIFVSITYSTYRVWYGVIEFIVLSTISTIWFIFSRNEMIDECDYTDDDKHQIYNRTIVFYSLLVILFTMLIPQMVATTQSNVVTTIMSLDYYSLWLLLIGFFGLSATIIFNLIHSKKIHFRSLKIPNIFRVQNLIVIATILLYLVIGFVVIEFSQILAMGLPVVIFIAISIYLYSSNRDSKKIFIIRLLAPITPGLMLLLIIAIANLNSNFQNSPIVNFITDFIAPLIILAYVGVILIYSIIGIIKKATHKEFDNLYRLYRHFIMLIISLVFITPFTLPVISMIISLSISVILFLIVDYYMEKSNNNLD